MPPRIVACWLVLAFAAPLFADQPAEILPPGRAAREVLPVSSQSCGSATCHGNPSPRPIRGSLAGHEFVRWSEFDPHAGAAVTILGKPFQDILDRMNVGRSPEEMPALRERCAACHNPEATAAKGSGDSLTALGIGCQSCHGDARHWIARHYERDVTREELHGLGMLDTKDLHVRAKQCAGCHIGDATHDMNHDMIAAGHPPLRFELSAYHDLIGKKHWPEAERLREPEFKVKLWAAGQAAAAENTLALLKSRASRAARHEPVSPWPEFAEYDCFACHQRLRPGGEPNPVPARAASQPGMPAWQAWNLSFAESLRKDSQMVQFRAAMEGPFRDNAAAVHALFPSEIPAVAPANLSLPDLLTLLSRDPAPAVPSWSSTTHRALALQAAYLASRDNTPAGESAASQAFARRLRAIKISLAFGSKQFEWPAFDWMGLPRPAAVPFSDLPAISAELTELASQLQAESAAPRADTPQPSQP
ncbi:MAG: multiheme c-type cytochrome [Pirellulaceae bacterium]|nr:multiheme c-type cytochrome [Pirellulaceae bacterium]